MNYKIISGGQTGADQGGLKGAKESGFETGGWAPYKFLTEIGYNKDLKLIYNLKDSYKGYKDRTYMNVRDSDITLWFGNTDSSGYYATKKACLKNKKQIIVIKEHMPCDIARILKKNKSYIINIAGNRESHNAGIQERVRIFIKELCRELI